MNVLSTMILVVATASVFPAVFECFVERLDQADSELRRGNLEHRLRGIAPDGFRKPWCIIAYIAIWICVFIVAFSYTASIPQWPQIAHWRLAFERFTCVPSGVSPIFPALFLAIALVAAAYFQLASRRSFRMSYLPSDETESKERQAASHFERILIMMPALRTEVDRLLYKFWEPQNVTQSNKALLCLVIFLILHIIIRSLIRGLPHSLEGGVFDGIFWSAFMIAFVLVLFRTVQLSALWRQVKKMLHLAVELPLSQAYDRIPSRFKGWFFGDDDFEVRDELIRQQSAAVSGRCLTEVADILREVENAAPATHPFVCQASAGAPLLNLPKGHDSQWHVELQKMRKSLSNSETLASTRGVYAFLRPLWDSLPVEDVPRRSSDDAKKAMDADWLESWPLTPRQSQQLKDDSDGLNRDQKLAILRNWARTAEDLVALQIVRWFAPALSNLVPMMQFLVLASVALLLAVTSYPFDHKGWLTTMMVCLILFVGGVVGVILVGVNRDELISRVSDTTPGRLTLDSNFIGSLLTIVGPLVGALVAVSFDMSDLFRTWFGPLFQFF